MKEVFVNKSGNGVGTIIFTTCWFASRSCWQADRYVLWNSLSFALFFCLSFVTGFTPYKAEQPLQ